MLRALPVAASLLGVATFAAANTWDDRRRMSDTTEEPPYLSAVWSTLMDRHALPYWAATVAAGAVNGMAGAWSGLRGNRRAAPVAVVPLLLLLYPLALFVQHPDNSKSWVGVLIVVVILGLFVWVAGRVGQEVGWWQRPAERVAAPDRRGT
ncbi:MAG TPA: hypothetical protein VH120_20230 [Gemmataceae bacterium]|nr:hypothetical protein [Gemmataceae bacterium]